MHLFRVYLLTAAMVGVALSGSIAAAEKPSTEQAVFFVQ